MTKESIYLKQHKTIPIGVIWVGVSTSAAGANDELIDTDIPAAYIDDIFNDERLFIYAGTGAGQTRKIEDYDAGTGKFTLHDTWVTNPDTTSRYQVIAGDGVSGAGAGDATAANQATILNALYDAAGIATYPAAAVPGDGVSLAEVLRQVYNDILTLGGYDATAANQATIIADTEKIFDAALGASPIAGSLASFIASGGTALGTKLAASKSILDALGHNGTIDLDVGILGQLHDYVTDDAASIYGRLGAFTGPVGGGAQDDNVKASLDLAHTDLDTIIADVAAAEAKVDTAITDIASVNTDIGDFSGQGNLQSLLAALGIPDVLNKPLYTCLVTDRLDNGSYGLLAIYNRVPSVSDVILYPVAIHAGTTEITDDGTSPALYADAESGAATTEGAPNVHWVEYISHFEREGTINVISIFAELRWQHKTSGGTAYSKIQITGDGGAAWVDVTDNIAETNATYQVKTRIGVGQFLPTITAGASKLGFRLVSWEAGGATSNAKIRSDSYVRITYRKA